MPRFSALTMRICGGVCMISSLISLDTNFIIAAAIFEVAACIKEVTR